MFQESNSAEYSTENNYAVGSIVPISKVVKNTKWGSEIEVRELLQHRFAASSLPFDVRLRVYTELMMSLSSVGLVFVTETKSDRSRFYDGLCAEVIQEVLLPEMDYKSGNC